MTQSIEPPPNYRTPGAVSSLTAPLSAPGTAETTVLSYIVPAGSFNVGTVYRMHAFGLFTAPSNTATVTYRVKIGTLVLADGTAVTPGATTASQTWDYMTYLVCTATGTAGRFGASVLSRFQIPAAAGHRALVPAASATNVDTTLSQTISVTVQWSAAPTLWQTGIGHTVELLRL